MTETKVNHSMNIGTTNYGILPEISDAAYSKFKENAKKFQPRHGKLDFSKFNFEKDGNISYKTDKGNSVSLNVTDVALRRLCEELGLNKKFKPGTMITKNLILNVLKEAKSNMSMNFSMNTEGVINNLTRKESKMINYETYFDLFERVMDDSKLDLNQLSFNESDGSLMINVRSNTQIGFDKEIFNTGVSYQNRLKGFEVSGFVGRMVCTNGMVIGQKDSSFRTESLNSVTIPRYLEFMKQLKNNNYQPLMFTQKWKDANSVPASIAEVEQTANLISSKIPYGDLELYIPGYNNMIETISKKIGFIETIPNESLVNLKSPFTVANCLNAITDVASHTIGISGKESRNLQVAAGQMLYKDFDTLNIHPQIF